MILKANEFTLGHIIETHPIPATMFEAVDQYRSDLVEDEILRHGKCVNQVSELFGQSEFGRPLMAEFSPYFSEDSDWWDRPVSNQVTLFPTPATVADMNLFPAGDLWTKMIVPQPLLAASDEDVFFFARLVAMCMLDVSWQPRGRHEALVYISHNNHNHPARIECARNASLLRSFSRKLEIPDMVEKRRRDIEEAFRIDGRPLEPFELECLPLDAIAYAAEHDRTFVLDNLHPTFCNICQRKINELIAQHQALEGNNTFRN